MKLWILRPIEGLPEEDDPWEPWYDKAFGFVVRAETEDEARELAHTQAGDELVGAWKNSKYSTCVVLSPEGDAEVIMRDFASA